MRFFTRDWFSGELDDDAYERVIADYRRHLRRVSPFLPPGARELAGSVPRFAVHDSYFESVTVDELDRTVHLELINCPDPEGWGTLVADFSDAGLLEPGREDLVELASDPRSMILHPEIDVVEGSEGMAELRMLGFYGRRNRERRPPASFGLAVIVLRFAAVRLTWHPRSAPDDDPPRGEVVFRP